MKKLVVPLIGGQRWRWQTGNRLASWWLDRAWPEGEYPSVRHVHGPVLTVLRFQTTELAWRGDVL
jgi:hypothetical protein